MRIVVKKKDTKDIKIVCPIYFLRFAMRMGFFFIKFSNKYDKTVKYIKMIDNKTLNKALKTLSNNKGLVIVDVEDSEGEGVKIII